jgi:sec-independent protein translocase protein TatA
MFNSILLGAIGPTEIILILVGLLILFGGKKIPQLMKGLGEGMREFKKASKGETEETTQKENTSESTPIKG